MVIKEKIYVSRYVKLIVQIAPATFRVDGSGKSVSDGGKAVRFTDGQYNATSPEEIKALEASKSFEVDFFDLDKQKNAQLEAEGKGSNAGAVKVIEGMRATNKQYAEFHAKQEVKEKKAEEAKAAGTDNNATPRAGQPSPTPAKPKRKRRKKVK